VEARTGEAGRGVIASSSSALYGGATTDPYEVALRAYVWGYAPVLAARLRQGATNPIDPFVSRLPTSAGAPLNNLGHQQRLSDPTLAGVAPNVDTLYTLAWLDLADEPFVLETPDFDRRYYTFQIAYADTATDVSLGARTHGRRLSPIFLSGPGDRTPTPDGMLHVRSRTRYLLVAGRILVQPDDARDYAAVYDLQSRIRLRTLTRYAAGEEGPNPVPEQRPLDEGGDTVPPELSRFNELGNVLRDWTVDPAERDLIGSFESVGLSIDHGFRSAALDAAVKANVAQAIRDGEALIESKTHDLGRDVNGWTINYDGPRFRDDYLLRAAVAKDQIYVTVPEEALYPVAKVDVDGAPFDGNRAYRLVFNRDELPPVDAFWSVTMYRRDQYPLVPNAIGRHAIGDRTRGLTRDGDGSVTIRIQHEPTDHPQANWLPAPRGPFHLMLRLYVPRASVLDGSWVPPPVERGPL
jgi:hypothetical protein